MAMKIPVFFMLNSLLLFFPACDKKAEDEVLVKFRSLPVLRFCNIEQIPSDKQKHHVIKSQQEYQTLMGCRVNVADINFNKEFLLAGWKAYTDCASKKSEEVRLVRDRIRYEITVERKECTSLDTVFFMVALPVDLRDKPVSFSIID